MIIDTVITIPEQRLQTLFATGLRQAHQTGRPVLVSVVLRAPNSDPLAFFARAASLTDQRSFWANPHREYAIAGVDSAWSLTLSGGTRFTDADTAWRALCANALIDNPFNVAATGPLLIGGFAFDPLRPSTPLWQAYPDGALVLPRFMLTTSDNASWLTINTVLWPHSNITSEQETALRVYDLFDHEPLTAHTQPNQISQAEDVMPADEWKSIVRLVERKLQHGEADKVVIARQYRVQGRNVFDPAQVVARLRASYADCFLFALAHGDQCFLGASPERLVRLRDHIIQATCLAGSIARGTTPEQDQQLGEALLASAKDRAEHEFVAQAIGTVLAEVSGEPVLKGALTLMKLRNVQHLFTPISSRLTNGRSILDLVARLHPTPAMGGVPRQIALEIIRTLEGLDRGWYASPVGWVDARGEGEFAVAIRCALLHGSAAALFAGCGIVAGSDPEREYAESCLKLRPILAALDAG